MNNQGIQSYFQFKNVNWPDMWSATWETIWMTVVSIAIVAILGLLLGLLLFETSGSDKLSVKILNVIVGVFVNIFRSIPFIILIVLLLPLTQVLVGSITGAKAGIPALVIGASPMYARLVEIAFHEVDKGVIEAAVAMGANKWQILYKVLIPESLPALVSGITVSTIALIGYIAMGWSNRCRWVRTTCLYRWVPILQQCDNISRNCNYRFNRICFPMVRRLNS